PLETLTAALGVKFDYWVEKGRSGTYAGGFPNFLDYTTKKVKPYIEFKYSLGAFSASYHLEIVKKVVDTSDATKDFRTGVIWRNVLAAGPAFEDRAPAGVTGGDLEQHSAPVPTGDPRFEPDRRTRPLERDAHVLHARRDGLVRFDPHARFCEVRDAHFEAAIGE